MLSNVDPLSNSTKLKPGITEAGHHILWVHCNLFPVVSNIPEQLNYNLWVNCVISVCNPSSRQ